MTAAGAADAVESFRGALAALTGMAFDTDRSAWLEEVLRERMRATGTADAGEYLEALPPRPSEIAELARLLTVSETYFFRNVEQFHAAEAHIRGLAPPDRRLSVLSAGCSSGEEAYSVAIMLHETLPDLAAWNVAIRGVDLNPDVLAKAERGRYSAWSLRETPESIRTRYFERDGKSFVIDDRVRALAAFERRNLVADDPAFWRPAAFDLVFCRNVLMYLTPDAAERVVANIARALVPGGLLFLGHAENLRGLSRDFVLRHSHGTFYYERRAGAAADGAHLRRAQPAEPLPAPRLAGTGRFTDTAWFDAIEQSTARVTALTDARAVGAAPSAGRRAAEPQGSPSASARRADASSRASALPRARAPARLRGDLAWPLELIAAERFADARAALAALPADVQGDPDVLLLDAVLLTCGGQPSAAEEVCALVLELDELNAGAHYVMALCREHAGDVERAIHHDETSAYLDPNFAMPRLHLGRLLRRRGDARAARHELDTAARLLAREDSSRIVLFGGGFTRDGLIELCRAERAACERNV